MNEHTETLEELRAILRSGHMSWGELHLLQVLAEFIEPGDVELLEAAGVPEFPDRDDDLEAEIVNRLDGDTLSAARWLCADTTLPSEYVRGVAELLIDTTLGLNQDEDKDLLMEVLVAPITKAEIFGKVLDNQAEAR